MPEGNGVQQLLPSSGNSTQAMGWIGVVLALAAC